MDTDIKTSIADRLYGVIDKIDQIWSRINIPQPESIVRFSGCEANEVKNDFKDRSYCDIEFDVSPSPEFIFEASDVGLQYYVGGIFRCFACSLIKSLSWENDFEIYYIGSSIDMETMLESKDSVERLFSGVLVSPSDIIDTLVLLIGAIQEYSRKLGSSKFDALIHTMCAVVSEVKN